MLRLPEEFVNQIRNDFDCSDELLDSLGKEYVRSLRINRRKNKKGIINDGDTLEKALNRKDTVSWEEAGIYYKEQPTGDKAGEAVLSNSAISYKYFPGRSPLHAAGAYYIQEASAMLPVAELFKQNAASDKVLDLCAAPGGKSTQIADYMNGRGLLISNEIVPSRAKILSENIERMGVTNAMVISEDPLKLKERFVSFFDRILVDAPCSGEGMFRKHNEAADEWSLENVDICADRQDMILDCAAVMLAPDGVIAYSTCTFNRKEDEGSVERFLNRHPEFELVESRRIYPHEDRGEGHFSAILRRKARSSSCTLSQCTDSPPLITTLPHEKSSNLSVTSDKKNISFSDIKNGKSGKDTRNKNRNRINKGSKNAGSKLSEAIAAFMEFALENMEYSKLLRLSKEDIQKNKLDADILARLILFGDRLFLTPEYMPDIEGLKVLRPGLHLGTIEKNRFEPSHAFALSLTKDEVTYSVNYEEGSQQALDYLKGMTLNHDGKKGWYLILVEGMSLGWGKLAGGVIKNHYPKGLRVQL